MGGSLYFITNTNKIRYKEALTLYWGCAMAHSQPCAITGLGFLAPEAVDDFCGRPPPCLPEVPSV